MSGDNQIWWQQDVPIPKGVQTELMQKKIFLKFNSTQH